MTKAGSARRALDAAIAHYQAGALDLAERACRKAVRGDRRDARTRNVLGVIIAAQGRIEEALKHFRAALALDPRSVHAATNLADAALNLGRFEEARTTLENALLVAEKIREAVEAADVPDWCTVSAGVAVFPVASGGAGASRNET